RQSDIEIAPEVAQMTQQRRSDDARIAFPIGCGELQHETSTVEQCPLRQPTNQIEVVTFRIECSRLHLPGAQTTLRQGIAAEFHRGARRRGFHHDEAWPLSCLQGPREVCIARAHIVREGPLLPLAPSRLFTAAEDLKGAVESSMTQQEFPYRC